MHTDMDDKMLELEEEFAFLEDWEDRYRYVIEMGKAMTPIAAEKKTDANKIQGCVSQVWLLFNQDSKGKYHFQADSDAHIVRGLIAVLLRLVDTKTAEDICNMDIISFFHRIGLSDNLSAQRANGLRAMIARIHQICSCETLKP